MPLWNERSLWDVFNRSSHKRCSVKKGVLYHNRLCNFVRLLLIKRHPQDCSSQPILNKFWRQVTYWILHLANCRIFCFVLRHKISPKRQLLYGDKNVSGSHNSRKNAWRVCKSLRISRVFKKKYWGSRWNRKGSKNWSSTLSNKWSALCLNKITQKQLHIQNLPEILDPGKCNHIWQTLRFDKIFETNFSFRVK